MRGYQQHFRTGRREIPERKISVPFHTPEFNLSEIPYPLIVISEAWKLLSRASPYISLHGVLPHTQFRNSWQVVMKLALRLVWSGSFFGVWVQTCYSQSTSSMEPFLCWCGPSSQTLLASNHFHDTYTSSVTRDCSLVVQFHRTMFHGHSSLLDMSS